MPCVDAAGLVWHDWVSAVLFFRHPWRWLRDLLDPFRFGGAFRDQVAFDFELEALLEERGALFTRDAQDGGIVARAPVGIREPDPPELVSRLGFE